MNMKKTSVLLGPTVTVGLWLLSSQSGLCFFDPESAVNGKLPAAATTESPAIPTHHEYGRLGEVIRATGPVAKADPARFSTRYQDDETHLPYYGYRYYNTSTGRWLSRDPVEERGEKNVYAFCRNSPISVNDFRGLAPISELVTFWMQGGMGPVALGRVTYDENVPPPYNPNANAKDGIYFWFVPKKPSRSCPDVNCHWVQYVMTSVYDKNGIAVGNTDSIYDPFHPDIPYYQRRGEWYTDDGTGPAGGAYPEPMLGVLWDMPGGNPTQDFPTLVKCFHTFLVCNIAFPDGPHFENQDVWSKDWSMTQTFEKKEPRAYTIPAHPPILPPTTAPPSHLPGT
jgi:RHS repeat-associated protein